MSFHFIFHHTKDIGEVHHELELAVVINKTCSKLESEDDWEDYVAGYGRCRDYSRHSKHTTLIPRCLAFTAGVTHSVASRHWSAGLHHTMPLHLPTEAIAVLFLLVDADLY